ncbi:hypothetical protein BDZ45DRAFT_804530 [Acephala macrosclerotiorum]|nr:hypothetical protein BDZ45DRAFT_804530 [Acephala macrosclerotiorum]
MMFATTIMALVGLSAIPMTLAGVALNDVPKGLSVRTGPSTPYPLGVMTFTGELGGHQVQLNGSVQEIHAQMKAKYPDFDADALVRARKLAARDGGSDVTLAARNKELPGNCCPCPGNEQWAWADAGRIQEGVDYLNNFNGLCNVGATSCVRISCSWNSGIYLCNDADHAIAPSCVYIASYATDLINHCVIYNPIGQGYVCGQEFDTDRYNVIVHDDSC